MTNYKQTMQEIMKGCIMYISILKLLLFLYPELNKKSNEQNICINIKHVCS